MKRVVIQVIQTGEETMKNHGGWNEALDDYRTVINDPDGDSAYLRESGLRPLVLELVNTCQFEDVLDVGCGDGWLFDAIKPTSGSECDVVQRAPRKRPWPYFAEDICNLSFEKESFDLVVASLVLIWIEDLQKACSELHRVCRNEGSLVVAIMHPGFYRMGQVLDNGDVVITHNYSQRRQINDLYIANKVGPFHYYHRPLSDYFNTLIRSGWRVEEFREWSMDIEDYKGQFGDELLHDRQRTERLPLYAFIKCRRKESE